MCACMINDSNFNNCTTNTKTTFKKVLLKKCSDVFYTLTTYPQEFDKLKKKMKDNNMVNDNIMLSYFLMIISYVIIIPIYFEFLIILNVGNLKMVYSFL